MTISLITDGMLYPIRTTLGAPTGGDGLVGSIPVAPCNPTATDPALQPPAVPHAIEASGPAIPVIPCGPIAYDPTIDPPQVPHGAEASEATGSEAPAVPRCPEGRKT